MERETLTRLDDGTLDSVRHRLAALLSEELPVEQETICLEHSLVDEYGLQSVDLVQLQIKVEIEFDLPDITAEEAEDLDTVADWIEYIEVHMR